MFILWKTLNWGGKRTTRRQHAIWDSSGNAIRQEILPYCYSKPVATSLLTSSINELINTVKVWAELWSGLNHINTEQAKAASIYSDFSLTFKVKVDFQPHITELNPSKICIGYLATCLHCTQYIQTTNRLFRYSHWKCMSRLLWV